MTDITTADIVFASALKVLGYPLVKITKVGNRGTFHFEDIPDDVVDDFNLGKIRVEPVDFNNALRAINSALRR